jgi:hypothetical protein
MKQLLLTLSLSFAFISTANALSSALLCAKVFALADPTSASDLLKNYRAKKSIQEPVRSKKLSFKNVNGRDVYNPTKPFMISFQGKSIRVMAARVESRDSELSEVMFFTEQEGVWSPLSGTPIFKMQDPFFTFIGQELIFGGVQIFEKPEGGYGYKTIFFRAHSLEELDPQHPFAQGPIGMKDIRLVDLKDENHRIGLFTRPQGMIPGTDINAGPGKIGFTTIGSLSELTPTTIIQAPLIQGLFADSEWGGANEAQILPDGRIAVLAHIAKFDAEKYRHYYSTVFTMDLPAGVVSPFEMVLERKDLIGGLSGNSKRDDLQDVVFSGGFDLDSRTLYVGAGDAEVHSIQIKKPDLFH